MTGTLREKRLLLIKYIELTLSQCKIASHLLNFIWININRQAFLFEKIIEKGKVVNLVIITLSL